VREEGCQKAAAACRTEDGKRDGQARPTTHVVTITNRRKGHLSREGAAQGGTGERTGDLLLA